MRYDDCQLAADVERPARLGAAFRGAETYYLGAMNCGADPQGPFL